ncbi:uncharacterized protein LOC134636708 [Pelmatolapia mariae]|uniref:uncharacterized protein LOC134636708 n=1 Tax=Pelmatolapia mariae TaxID=158779 RepID=UPI002FE6955E
MSTISEEDWKTALFQIVKQLNEPQYKTMMLFLSEIPKSVKTTESREEMPQVIIEHYGVETSVHKINKIMDQIPRKDAAVQDRLRPFVERLKKKQEDERRAPGPSTGATGVRALTDESVSSSSRKRKVDKTESAGSVMPKKKKTENKVSSLKSTGATKTTKAAAPEKPKEKENKQKAKKKDELRSLQPDERKSIHDVKISGDLGNKPIAGKVLAKSVLRTSKPPKKEKMFFFYLGVADETGSIKVVVYGRERYQRFQEKSCYLFRNVIMDENVMKVTKKSGISKMAPIDVPENLEMEAQRLGYSQTPVCSIRQAIGSEGKTSVSVEGKVTEIGTLKKKQGAKNRKEFQLEDGTGSIWITLWGEYIKQLRGKSPGDSVRVVNVETNHYEGSVSLNSTDFTRISKERVVSKQNSKQESKKKESVSSSSRKRKVDKTESAGSVMPKKKKTENKVSSLKSTGATKTTKAAAPEKPKEKENKQKAKKKGQKHFVDEHRNELIQRVSNIAPILDDLLQEDIIHQEAYDDISAQRTSQKKMRELFSHILKAGDASKEAFYQVLRKHEKMLIEDLTQNSTK